jgi:hypothetical protein
MLHPATIATLERTPAVLRTLLEGLPDEVVHVAGDEGWSPLDVMAHLLSVHRAANLQRVRWMLDADNPSIANIDEERVLESSGMREWPLDRLLDEFADARTEIMEPIRALTPEQLTRTGRHEVAGTITIADVLHHVAYHDLLHIAQVARLLLAPLDERRGAMQAGFPDQS